MDGCGPSIWPIMMWLYVRYLEWKRRRYAVTVRCGRILGNCISMNRDEFSYYFVEVLSNLSSVMSIIEVFYVPELLSAYHHIINMVLDILPMNQKSDYTRTIY